MMPYLSRAATLEVSGCVSVPREDAERLRRRLLQLSLLRRDLRPKVTGDKVLLPVANVEESVRVAKSLGILAEACKSTFARYRKLEERIEGLSSYTLLGEVAIINYRGKDPSAYERLAELIMMKHPKVRAVYLKLRTQGAFRLPELVLVRGERVTETEFKEYGLRFRVDVTKAYVNPRLASEHRRVAEAVSDGEDVLDMFSGIGPFSIHIASLRSSRILAVDINPYASYYAAMNVKLNRRALKGRVVVMRADARILANLLDTRFDRIIMNNPTGALSFVDVACRLLKRRGILHIYKLVEREERLEEVVERRLKDEGCEVLEMNVKKVREYSPDQVIVVADVYVNKATS
jgi:tRNA (guanine37-N1)-methyltransferase